MPDSGVIMETFQACLRAPFATLGITTSETPPAVALGPGS